MNAEKSEKTMTDPRADLPPSQRYVLTLPSVKQYNDQVVHKLKLFSSLTRESFNTVPGFLFTPAHTLSPDDRIARFWAPSEICYFLEWDLVHFYEEVVNEGSHMVKQLQLEARKNK